MADKVLSQAEVDALLNGVSSGTVKTEAAQAPLGIRAYDLTSQDRIIRGRMPTLDIINERFSRVFQVTLSSTLRKTVEFSPLSVEVIKFNEFMRRVPVPSSLNILKMEPLRGNILLSLDARLVFILLDYFFGGKGQTYVKAEGRDFTPIEQKFIEKIVDLLIVDLQKAWYPVYPATLSMVRREINPQFAMIVAPTEVTITVVFKLELEDKTWNIYLCLPYPTIEPIREKLYGGFQSDQLEVDRQWGERFKNQLQGCNVNVTAELGTADLTLRDLGELSAGDIILLDKGVNEELRLKVEDRTKFLGTAGIFNGNTSVKIKRVVRYQEDEINGE